MPVTSVKIHPPASLRSDGDRHQLRTGARDDFGLVTAFIGIRSLRGGEPLLPRFLRQSTQTGDCGYTPEKGTTPPPKATLRTFYRVGRLDFDSFLLLNLHHDQRFEGF